jgi:hypothetical protein
MITFARAHHGAARAIRNGIAMTTLMRPANHRQPVPDHEQKRVALGYLNEAWAEARLDGIDGDCLAQACLFTALAELVSTYGEDATAQFAEGLAPRIRNREFSIELARQ